MKKTFLLLALICSLSFSAMAQTKFVDAVELGIHGSTKKTDKGTYYRFDHTPYEGFSKAIISHSMCPAGLYIVFKTNSSTISAKCCTDLVVCE